MNYIFFTLLGYCLGSIMFAYWIPYLMRGIDIRSLPSDHNPGVANAYTYGGFLSGTLALLFELAKGFFPVFLSRQFLSTDTVLFAPVMIAPVFGHACPYLNKEKGGKAITVSFGVVLGLFPEIRPLLYLIFFFLFFSLVLVISPHSFRTILTFSLFACTVFFRVPTASIRLGCFGIAAIVIIKHLIKYEGEQLRAHLFWHH